MLAVRRRRGQTVAARWDGTAVLLARWPAHWRRRVKRAQNVGGTRRSLGCIAASEGAIQDARSHLRRPRSRSCCIHRAAVAAHCAARRERIRT
jgi:hypothetical protein